MFVGLDRNTARSWQAAQVPRWVPGIVLVGAAVAAFVVSVAMDDSPCSVTDPRVCGPDPRFTVAFALLLATPILLWWLPLLGCVTGVGFAAADVAFDPFVKGRGVWGAFGGLCVLVGLWLVWSGRRQRAVVERLGQTRARPGPPDALDKAQGRSGQGWTAWVPVAFMLVLGVAALIVYGIKVAPEREHLDVAVRLDARVVAYDADNYLVTVDTGSAGRRVIDVLDDYSVGTTVPVLIDPRDPSWARLVAEPADFTFPQTIGLDCLLLAGCLAWRQLRVRRADHWLLTEDVAALAVLVRPTGHSTLTVYASDDYDGERPVALLSTSGPPDNADEDDPDSANRDDDTDDEHDIGDADDDVSPFRSFKPIPATVFGSFQHRARVVLVTDRTVPLFGRLQAIDAVSQRFRFDPGAEEPLVEEPVALEPSAPPTAVTPSSMGVDADLTTNLPRTVRHSLLDRLVFGIYAVAGLAGVPAIELLVDSARWYNRIFVAILGLEFVAYCAGRATTRLVLSREALTVTGMFLVRVIPWHRVDRAKVDRKRIAIAYKPAATITRGPYTARKCGGPSAESMAAAIMSLRASALAVGANDAPIRTRLSVARVAFLGLYAFGAAVSVWLAIRPG